MTIDASCTFLSHPVFASHFAAIDNIQTFATITVIDECNHDTNKTKWRSVLSQLMTTAST